MNFIINKEIFNINFFFHYKRVYNIILNQINIYIIINSTVLEKAINLLFYYIYKINLPLIFG